MEFHPLIVDFPRKNAVISIATIVYQRVKATKFDLRQFTQDGSKLQMNVDVFVNCACVIHSWYKSPTCLIHSALVLTLFNHTLRVVHQISNFRRLQHVNVPYMWFEFIRLQLSPILQLMNVFQDMYPYLSSFLLVEAPFGSFRTENKKIHSLVS